VSGVVIVAVVLFTAVSSSATSRTFQDGDNPNPHAVDISSVRVENSTVVKHQVIVNIYVNNFEDPQANIGGDILDLYLDTNPIRKGPEFHVRAYEQISLTRMRSWSEDGLVIPCADSGHGTYDYNVQQMTHPNRYRVWIQRSCLDYPGRVRVAVHLSRHGTATTIATQDWAKARRTWLGWVSR
jgi:hypothetical protein